MGEAAWVRFSSLFTVGSLDDDDASLCSFFSSAVSWVRREDCLSKTVKTSPQWCRSDAKDVGVTGEEERDVHADGQEGIRLSSHERGEDDAWQ